MQRSNRAWVPFTLGLAWLFLIGWLVWRHAMVSDQPLIGDARGYWEKARSFWSLVATGHWANPFNIEPTKRPPGTILLSYPFGFSESFKGFLFRSIFVPIVLTWAAVQVTGRLARKSGDRKINIACLAVFICSAPLFFHFEYDFISPGTSYWGLVDNFMGAAGALSAALALYAAMRSSRSAALGAGLFASLCFCIKPTGLVVAVLVCLVWLIVALATAVSTRFRLATDEPMPSYRALLFGVLIYCAAVIPMVVIGRYFSTYFSAENIQYGDRAVGFLREAWLLPSFLTVVDYVRQTTGPLLTIAVVIALALGLVRSRQVADTGATRTSAMMSTASFSAALFIIFGLWFWLIYTGGSQARYAYPFLLGAIIFLVPVASDLISRAGPRTRLMLRVLLVFPALNIMLLLATFHPPAWWEYASGVNVRKTDVAGDMSMARGLLGLVRSTGRNVVVYEDFSGRSGILDSYWGFEISAHPGLPNVHVANPVDFLRTATFRVREVADADFLLFWVLRDEATIASELRADPIDSFVSEEHVFRAWVSSLSVPDGIQVYAQTDDLKLLKIVDHAKFEESLNNFVKGHHWRSIFTEANPAAWWSDAAISNRSNLVFNAAQPIRFDGGFEIRALALTKDADQLHLDLWWRSNPTSPIDDNWYFFVHELDGAGVAVKAENVRLRAFGEGASDQYMLQSITLPINPKAPPTSIGIGIFRLEHGNATTAKADSGNRDWGDHRVLISLPKQSP